MSRTPSPESHEPDTRAGENMQDHPVLGHVWLGYSPFIDRQRAVPATRLTVFPERPDAAPDAQALLAALVEVWPADAPGPEGPAPTAGAPRAAARPLDPASTAKGAAGRATVSLNLAGESLLGTVMQAAPGPQFMVEVPCFMASDAQYVPALRHTFAGGASLMIKGRPTAPVPAETLALFSHAIVDAGDERRGLGSVAPGVRQVSTVQAGVRTSVEIGSAFERGAVAVLGWPWDDSPPRPLGRGSVPADIQVVMELIDGVEKEHPPAKLEAVLRRDPTLAFRLMRYLNSPAFGVSVEINSFGHALAMLGHQRLKRWLALLLASSAKGANAKPVMFAAVRRGLLLEALCRDSADTEMRGEMFICGVFSLLDRLLQQPLADLLAAVPVPDRVQHALRDGSGPYAPYLELVRAIENEARFDIREQADALVLSPAAINRAVLSALRSARQLDG
jgi:c-di-GMP phosphodiesterase